MDAGDHPGELGLEASVDMEINANKLKDIDEPEPVIPNGDGEEHFSNGMVMDLEADFDAQLNDLNRSSAVGLSQPIWSSPEDGNSPTDNDPDVPHDVQTDVQPEDVQQEDYSPRDAEGGDDDIATEGSLDLEVDHGGDIATEGSLDLDIDIPDAHHPTDRYVPLGAGLDLGGSVEGEPITMENPETEPLKQQEPDEYDGRAREGSGEEERQKLLQDEGIAENGAETGALETEGSLDLDVVGAHVEDEDDDADVFESNEKLDVSVPVPTYVNTTLVSNASSSLGGHEPAPAHAQSLITPFRDDVNNDVTVADRARGGDAGRTPSSGEEDITVIEPTTETNLLDHKENGDVLIPMQIHRKGFPPPFPIGYNDQNLHKGNWSHKMEFICAIFCVIFNIYTFVHFPYTMCDNGGVVFLIPYMLALFLLILPLVLLEISLGQFASASFLTCWKFCPLIKGLSLGMLLQLFGYAFLSGPFTAQSLYYIYTAAYPGSPHHLVYSSCDNVWNTAGCELLFPLNAHGGNETAANYTVMDHDEYAMSVNEVNTTGITTSPEEEFFRYHVKMEADSTNSLEAPVTHLMICLGVAWLLVFHITLFGIKSFGKVAYVLVSCYILLLLVLLIRGALLEGALNGIKLLFWPDIEMLLEYKVWWEAFTCAMYTFTPMCGIFMSLSSYNKFHNNCFLDSVVLILVCILVNLLSAVTFFTYIGYGTNKAGMPIQHITDHSADDTIFVLLAMIFSSLPHARIMSILLFFFSFLSSLGFQVVVAVSLMIGFLDAIGCRHSWKAIIPLSLLISLVCFGGGLLFVTPEGAHFLVVMDRFFLGHIPFLLSIIIPLALTWIYGTIPAWKFLKFQRDIKAMVGCFPVFFQALFAGLEAIFLPLTIAVGWVFTLYFTFSQLDLSFEAYQGWHVAIAIIVAFVPLIIGFLSGAVMELCKYVTVYRYFTELFWLAAMPLREWGPAVEEIRIKHDYPVIKVPRDDMIQEEKYTERSQENINNANDSRHHQGSIGYSMSLHNEGSLPPSPTEKREIVYPQSSSDTLGRDHDPAVNSNATLPAGTPLLGLSLCSHETTL